MAREVINVGAAPNDGQGDPIRTSFIKTNNNFGELYARAQENPPATLVGSTGDFAGMYAYDANFFYYCYADYDGSSTIWAEIPNTVIDAIEIVNGTSNVSIPTANGNVRIAVAGTSNLAVFTNTGAIINGDLTVTGNANLSGNIVGDRITNGSSGVEIPAANGNVTVSVAGIANTTVFTAAGPSAAGNVFGGNIVIPNGKRLLGDFTANVDAGRSFFQTSNTSTSATTFVTLIPGANNLDNFGASLGVFANIDYDNSVRISLSSYGTQSRIQSVATGNAASVPIVFAFTNSLASEAARIMPSGNVGIGNTNPVDRLAVNGSAYISGNVVSGGVFTGNGAGLTNVTAVGNVGAASKLASGTSELNIPVANGNIVGNIGGVTNLFQFSTDGFSAQGNITGAYIIGDGSLLTGLPSTYTDSDVTSLLASFGANTYLSTGNVTSGNLRTTGIVSATGNVIGGNISTTGNVTGGYILGNGALLTGVASSYGNAEVVANLAALSSNPISTTGNVSAGYFIGNGSQLTGVTVTTTYGNANVAGFLAAFGSNVISTAGNVTVNDSARVTGQLYGLVNGVNTNYGVWDFGFIAANTYTNPMQWIFAQTSAGNVDMGTITAPASLSIDVGTIF